MKESKKERLLLLKRPFASMSAPGDPLLEARYRAIRDAGLDPFMSYQVPQAVIALKQGAGRLLRDDNDYGVIVLCDPRVSTKNYGSLFLKCLAPMNKTDSIREVKQFLKSHQARQAETRSSENAA